MNWDLVADVTMGIAGIVILLIILAILAEVIHSYWVGRKNRREAAAMRAREDAEYIGTWRDHLDPDGELFARAVKSAAMDIRNYTNIYGHLPCSITSYAHNLAYAWLDMGDPAEEDVEEFLTHVYYARSTGNVQNVGDGSWHRPADLAPSLNNYLLARGNMAVIYGDEGCWWRATG
jgi:hypothetical protein